MASWPLALTAYCAARAPRPGLDWRDGLAIALFALAFAGETVADQQMAGFKQTPANRGRICDQGLWAWSRHPNYFFEWLGWLAYPIMAVEAGYPAGWLTLSGPLVIYVLLVHVSGVPPLEAHLSRSRPAEFAAYAENVSAFWPRPPRRSTVVREAVTKGEIAAGRGDCGQRRSPSHVHEQKAQAANARKVAWLVRS